MKHARDDYMRIQDPDGIIPDDEPVFLLRGQDVAAPAAVEFWANEVERCRGRDDIVASAREQARKMREWQRNRMSKLPDLPGSR
jgi:hypothetical protein